MLYISFIFICITNYDPFGYDQMVYSIKNGCEEVPELVYNDGVKIYYFNSVGTKGGTEKLKTFLKYIVESKKENIVDEATEEIGNYVNHIKRNNQMEGDYMTVGEWVDGIAEDAVNDAVEKAVSKVAAEKDAKIAEYEAKIKQLEGIIESTSNK